jgi:hypothetical protein
LEDWVTLITKQGWLFLAEASFRLTWGVAHAGYENSVSYSLKRLEARPHKLFKDYFYFATFLGLGYPRVQVSRVDVCRAGCLFPLCHADLRRGARFCGAAWNCSAAPRGAR